MGRIGAVLAAVGMLSVGCASQRAAVRADSSEDTRGGERRYVDASLGFELVRPEGEWQLEAKDQRFEEGVSVPVVLRHPATGSQVVLQIAPTVGTPGQLAEKLSSGLRNQPGLIASEPELVGPVDGAVGFNFAMGDQLLGRVTVLDGQDGQTLMLLATWPPGAPSSVAMGVEEIFGSVRPIKRKASSGFASVSLENRTAPTAQ